MQNSNLGVDAMLLADSAHVLSRGVGFSWPWEDEDVGDGKVRRLSAGELRQTARNMSCVPQYKNKLLLPSDAAPNRFQLRGSCKFACCQEVFRSEHSCSTSEVKARRNLLVHHM